MNLADTVEGTGFSTEPLLEKPRVIWDITKKAKAGGTDFAVRTSPSLIAYQGFDTGDEGVVNKHQFDTDGKLRITRASYKHLVPTKVKAEATTNNRSDQDGTLLLADVSVVKSLYRGVVAGFERDFKHMIGKARTIVWDTGTDLYDALRLASFGKLMQVKSQHYGPIYHWLVQQFMAVATQGYTSLITISQGRDEWVTKRAATADSEEIRGKSGKLERANWHDKVDFLVQAFFEARYVDPIRNTQPGAVQKPGGAPGEMVGPNGVMYPGHFELELVRSRHKPEYVGTVWRDKDITFQNVATLLYPDVDPEVWFDPHPSPSADFPE